MPLAIFFQKFALQIILKHQRSAARGASGNFADRRSSRRTWFGILISLALPIGLANEASGAQNSPTLVWNPNPENDIAGYVVYIGTSSGEYPTIEDVGDTTSFTPDNLSPVDTYYCAVQAYNSAGLMSELSSEVSFSLIPARLIYDSWASTSGLSGDDAEPSAMPFHDGVPNLAKYAFNMNATGPDNRMLPKETGTAGLPTFTLDRSGAQPMFAVEFLRRKGSGMVYTPKTTTDFSTYTTMTGTTTVTDIDGTWERVLVEKAISTTTHPKLFGRVDVTLP